MYLNGEKYTKSYINYDDIKNGVKIHFVMSNKPNYKRGTKASDIPASVSEKGKTKVFVANK